MTDNQFSVAEQPSDWSWSLGDGRLRMYVHTSKAEKYYTGEFVDPRGIATVYRENGITRIDFAHQGRCYSRSWQRAYGDRTIARLCRAFITELLS